MWRRIISGRQSRADQKRRANFPRETGTEVHVRRRKIKRKQAMCFK